MPHADTLCGWLLPGPVSIAPLPPRLTAICAAVIELPYRFETLPLTVAAATLFAPTGEHVAAPVVPPTEQCVHMVEFVLLLGLFITILDFVLQGILIKAIPSLFAQAGAGLGSISGSVKDPSGASVPKIMM